MRHLQIISTLLVLSLTTTSVNAQQRWPGFLGAGSSQLWADSLPMEWSPESSTICWKTKLAGTGQSSPIIWGDTVFVTSIDGTMKEICHVTAISLTDGQTLWDYTTDSAQPVRSNYFQSRSAPTPAVDANGIYTFFETGKVVALTHDGKEKWVRNLVDEYGEFEVRIGLAASVAQTNDSVFILVDHEGPSYLLAIDKQSGETRWLSERFSRQSYASPIVLTISGQPQIVISSAGSVDGYNPDTGKQLWTMEGVGGNRSTTPLPFGDNRFLVSASPGMHDERLDEARESNFAMQIEKTADGFQTKVLWKTRKAMPSFGSPIVHQNLAYWVNNVGVLYCFNAETGESVYTKRSGQLCWATPLPVGDRIYLFGKDGLTTVIAAGPDFKVLAKNELLEGATEAGEADIRRRETRNREHHENSGNASPEKAPTIVENAPASDKETQPAADGSRDTSSRRGGRLPARTDGDADSSNDNGAPRTSDGRTFAEAVQYGYAAVSGSLVIRTGGHVYCLRSAAPVPAEKGIKK
jgi:outer membrane protein assembly factor BamB